MKTFDEAWAALEPNIDDYGLPVHFDMNQAPPTLTDAGDGLQRLSMAAIGLSYFNANRVRLWYRAQLSRMYCGFGNYRRHPAPDRWTFSPKIMSRDQLTPTIIAMGQLQLLGELFMVTLFLIFRLGFTTNVNGNHGETKLKLPDHFTWPHMWAMVVRAWVDCIPFLFPLAWPVLLVLDLVWPIAAVIAVIKAKKHPEHSDDLNFQLKLLQAFDCCPTPWTWIARKIYTRRPAPSGRQGWGPAEALRHYFGAPGAVRLDRVFVESGNLNRLQG